MFTPIWVYINNKCLYNSEKLLHHNFFLTQLLVAKVKTMLAEQPCGIQTKMSRLYRKQEDHDGPISLT